VNILKQNFCANFCSPIHCASINPNPELLDHLLSNIPDYNVGDSLNRKPVHYASAAVDSRNLEILVKHGSDLKDMDKAKMTPLMVAAYSGK
jgi:ankyrin repeat protein